MEDEKLKQRAKDRLVILDKHLKLLRQTEGLVGLIKAHAVKNQLHKRAVYSRTTLVGLDFLINELKDGQAVCMEILGGKKVPIVVKNKLKLITGGK